MKPAERTRSGRYDATEPVSAASHSSRLSKSLTRCTNVGIPARVARARPSMPSRSAPTATTAAPYAGSVAASSRAWRFVPDPDNRTTTRSGVAGTARSLGGAGRRTLAVPCAPVHVTRWVKSDSLDATHLGPSREAFRQAAESVRSGTGEDGSRKPWGEH